MPTIFKAELISEEEYLLSADVKIIERFWNVPLDYQHTGAESAKIRIFGRTAIPVAKEKEKLQTIVYLQGGPGFECSTPQSHPVTGFLHEKGYQVLYLDQRGTGLSSPISANRVLEQGSLADQTKFLKLFRATNIVRDLEAVRECLLGSNEKEEERKWSLIGQSFGGFIAVHYLSAHPEGLKEVFTTGGMPPLVNEPSAVYQALVEKTRERNEAYFRKYPKDLGRVQEIMKHLRLAHEPVHLPNGSRLTPNRFAMMGLNLGSTGGIDTIHAIVLRAASELESLGKFSYKLLQTIEHQSPYEGNLLYAIMHEAIYCQGQRSGWAADSLLKAQTLLAWESENSSSPVYFIGEMIRREIFHQGFKELTPLASVAQSLAEVEDWEILYDVEKLKQNKVPVNSAIYVDDMYVDFGFAVETAKAIGNHKYFITNTMMHDAVRVKCYEVMGELFKLSKRVQE